MSIDSLKDGCSFWGLKSEANAYMPLTCTQRWPSGEKLVIEAYGKTTGSI